MRLLIGSLLFISGAYLLVLNWTSSSIIIERPEEDAVVLDALNSPETILEDSTKIDIIDTDNTPIADGQIFAEEDSHPTSEITTDLIPNKEPSTTQEAIYQHGLLSTVNLLCPIDARYFVVATGIIVSDDGYILSNAHVADDMDPEKSCQVRRGSPARTFATANLKFISQSFTSASTSYDQAPYDVALWKINTPGVYPFWNIDFSAPIHQNEQFLVQSYPAERLGGETILKNQSLLFSTTVVEENDGIILQTRSTIGAQKGSSGGVLIDPLDGDVVGLIFAVTDNDELSISERILFSLTPQAINTTFLQDTGKLFVEYLTSNP